MERSRFGSRLASLCASATIHVAVILIFLQPRLLGAPSISSADAHSSDILPLPVAMMAAVLESSPTQAAPHPAGDEPNPALRPIPVGIPSPSEISLPPMAEGAAVAAEEPILAGRQQIQCEVHIHQSPTGQIQAIDFGRCLGDEQWQHALMRAIEHAANLIQPSAGATFPAVRTLTVMTDAPSATLLARQLSADPDTTDTTAAMPD
jgi:hypothetical protein